MAYVGSHWFIFFKLFLNSSKVGVKLVVIQLVKLGRFWLYLLLAAMIIAPFQETKPLCLSHFCVAFRQGHMKIFKENFNILWIFDGTLSKSNIFLLFCFKNNLIIYANPISLSFLFSLYPYLLPTPPPSTPQSGWGLLWVVNKVCRITWGRINALPSVSRMRKVFLHI